MNRQIKFRAWDKSCNKMRGIKGLQDCFSLRSDGVSNDDYILMQFTGLVDINEKEIYELDIVKSTENRKYKVVWHQGGFHIMGLTKSNNVVCYPLNLGILDNKEVIGNIYENPELLKDK
jgi:uncharacterized phage protein (TIGR01671 family)